jgi:hypothetical protein
MLPRAMEFGPDESLYYSDGDRIDRVTLDGWDEQVAGNVGGNDRPSSPGPFFSGDGCPASGLPQWMDCPHTGAEVDVLGGKMAFAGDGTLYFADVGNHRVREVDSQGIVRTVVGAGRRGREVAATAARRGRRGRLSSTAPPTWR